MSSDSGSDCEFYDACDVTPNLSKTVFSRSETNNKVSVSPVNLKPPDLKIPSIYAKNLAAKPKITETLEQFSTDLTATVKTEIEESSSACSGSLLGNLGDDDEDDDDDSVTGFKHGKRTRRQRDVRRYMSTEVTEVADKPDSPCGSRSSSLDAVYPSVPSYPFRVVEHDATSIYSAVSLGKIGKLLAGADEVIQKNDGAGEANNSTILHEETNSELNLTKEATDAPPVIAISPEPDLVASTKSSSGSDKSNSLPRTDPEVVIPLPLPSSPDDEPVSVKQELHIRNSMSPSPVIGVPSPRGLVPVALDPVPVAPPRRRQKRKSLKMEGDRASVVSLPSPSSILTTSGTCTMEQSLDLRDAVRGDYLVKHQDLEQSKAHDSPVSSVHKDEIGGEDTVSQPSSPEVSRPPSRMNSQNFSQCSTSHLTSTGSESSVHEECMKEEDKSVMSQQLNMTLRTRSDSGKALSDQEILQQVSVLNLDTGERIPLSKAEECLPSALNPLSLHIMKITREYSSPTFNDNNQESDDECGSIGSIKKMPEFDSILVKKKTSQFKKFIERKLDSAVNKAKSIAHRKREEKDIFEEDTPAQNTMQYVKIKTAHSHKGPHVFDNLMYVQEIVGAHSGPVWCMKFSGCGRLLATAGQDHLLKVWVLKQAFNYFLDIRTKCNADVKVSPTPSQESLVSQHSGHSGEDVGTLDPNDDGVAPFMIKPFCIYGGHTADVLDISWSKNYFLLTSSMDKTVRLWHISRKECLCIFQHMDFVTAIVFHPKDDRYFISGALDGKLRLWSIPDKRVVLWNEVEGQTNLITAANFCQNGSFTVVGTYDGRCIFYETEQLKYFTQIHVRSTRRKNARGRKITGIEPLPGEDKVLVTSNDSRIRLYDLRDLNLSCKYKGYSNISSQIRASFSHDGKFIVAGSENQCIYIWKTHHDYSMFSSARRDRNVYWEGVKAHSAVVTCAIFAPHPELVFGFIEKQELLNGAKDEEKTFSRNQDSSTNKGYVLVSADFNGCMKVFLKKEKPKHSSLPASALA